MRQAFNGKWIFNEQGEMIGIDLGADYVAEHEFGIKDIHHDFDIPYEQEGLFGIEKRQIRKVPENSLFLSKFVKKRKTVYQLLFYPRWDFYSTNHDGKKMNHPRDLYLYGEKTLATAWDQKRFGIQVYKEDKKYLDELYHAFMRNDIAIGLGQAINPFDRGGLVMLIVSKTPEEVKTAIYEADYDYDQLQKAAEATKIYDILKTAKKGYYALSPSWTNNEKTDVHFFLNPKEQHKYNFGWYTVEELQQWANDKGPVMIKPEKVKAKIRELSESYIQSGRATDCHQINGCFSKEFAEDVIQQLGGSNRKLKIVRLSDLLNSDKQLTREHIDKFLHINTIQIPSGLTWEDINAVSWEEHYLIQHDQRDFYDAETPEGKSVFDLFKMPYFQERIQNHKIAQEAEEPREQSFGPCK